MQYKEGDFSFVQNSQARKSYQAAFDAISKYEEGRLWIFLKENTPPANDGWMFWNEPTANLLFTIVDESIEGGHSGATGAFTLRAMESIAKHGWTTFVSKLVERQNKN